MEDLLQTLFIIGAFQSFFFAIFILTQKKNQLPNLFMGIWLVVLGFSFVEAWIVAGKIYLQYPHLSGAFSGIPFLHGPLFYLYVFFLFNPQKHWDKRHWLHFLPFLLYYLSGLSSFFLQEGSEKIALMENLAKGVAPNYLMAWGSLKALHGLLYMTWIFRRLAHYEKGLLDQFSNLTKTRVQWLRILNVALWLIYLFASVNTLLVLIFELNLEFVLGLLSMALILVGGFFAMRQAELFKPLPTELSPVIPDTREVADFEEEKRWITSFVEEEKPYLNPDFSLADFAHALSLPQKELSRILNEGFGMNFFTFINTYRVKEVQKQIQDPQNKHLTLLGIGFQSGFNSKTTFNTVFKKFTQQTPSEYKRSLSSS